MDPEEKDACYFLQLPEELIGLILKKMELKEIVTLGQTCKSFYSLIYNDHLLWKNRCLETLPDQIHKTVETYCRGNWLKELKKFTIIKKAVEAKLMLMSPKFCWRINQITLDDIKDFFIIAAETERSYFYTISVLQNTVQIAQRKLEKNKGEKPFTLTDIYYAKIILQYLMHTFLAIKWVKKHMQQQLRPEIVVNFFAQWVDPANFYFDENVDEMLTDIVEEVKDAIRAARAIKPPPPGWKKVTDREVLTAMSKVLVQQRHIAITTSADLASLSIVKALKNKCSNGIVLAAIWQAVARKCGVKLELIAFPNHLFLEWMDDYDEKNVRWYTISMSTGELIPKRRCPFSQTNARSNYSYCPDSLLQYVYSSFLLTMGAIRNWHTQNALFMLNFLGTNQNDQNPYKNFFQYLIEDGELCTTNLPIDIKYLKKVYRNSILSLSTLNKPTETASHDVVVKKHSSNVLYAVGMVCYHKRFDYICIVRGWDLNGDHLETVNDLFFGRKQPFYRVTAADQSERYVAQENLTEVLRPSRIYHLEPQISKEFSHFDGFAYVLNDEKKVQYPDEEAIIEVHRNKALCKRDY
ncbi:uncharacterized protein LOC126966848 [Leptidea sinapis]|uniref:F-box domain-containing protein n=1 Tax=Leptidea sinapis TaxID=189913 RepID=A0A5E4PQ48_9NEOP|nr:uncharacterized protein LOC126966848 [Leptidea sinapis]VVC87417.1 unnamed protein product [Leptidea sinapis]